MLILTLTLDTVLISFDMQQNKPFPKLSISDVFYATTGMTFNFHMYTWLETQSGGRANQVSFAAMGYLGKLESKLREEETRQRNFDYFQTRVHLKIKILYW